MTTIRDSVYDAELNVEIASIVLTPSGWWKRTSDSARLAPIPISVTPTEEGELMVELMATDAVTALDGTAPTYSAAYTATAESGEVVTWHTTWTVPTSVTDLTLADVEV